MVYIFGIFGFIMGFGVGLGMINVMLRHYSQKEIQENKSFRWKYGVLVWGVAAFGAWAGTRIYYTLYL